MKIQFEDIAPAHIIIWIAGVVYLIITLIHFGLQYYDLDRLISNFFISLIILGFGWVIKLVLEMRLDVKAINDMCNDILNKNNKDKEEENKEDENYIKVTRYDEDDKEKEVERRLTSQQ